MAIELDTIVLLPEGVTIPAGVRDFDAFRHWTRSAGFPERGRIDFLASVMEVDMSPEKANAHGSVKAALAAAIHGCIDLADRGIVYIDRMRYAAPEIGLSVEPDLLAVLFESLEAGRVETESATSEEGTDFAEIRGAVDLVVEIVSDSSVKKDTRILRDLYWRAGVGEYWIVDAREERVRFQVLRRGPERYDEVASTEDGYVNSFILGRRVRLVRLPRRAGVARYRLEAAD